MAGSERTDNGPYEVTLGGRGFNVAEQLDPRGEPTGELQWKEERMAFVPGSPSPISQPYYVERNIEIPQTFANWRNGIGWREQPDMADKDANGIYYGRFIDKCGIYLGPSAAVTAFTPAISDTVVGGNQFAEIPILLAAPSAPSDATAPSGGTVVGGTYATAITYVGLNGETAVSSTTNEAVASGTTNTLSILSPAAVTSTNVVVGWHAYVSQPKGPAAPSLSAAGVDGSLSAGTYQVKITYVTAGGVETCQSTSTSQAITGTQHLAIASPSAPGDNFTAAGWYAYVTQANGSTYTRQQGAGSPTAIGAGLTLTVNPTNTGAAPPPTFATLTRQQVPGSPTAVGTNLTLTAMPTSTGALAPVTGALYAPTLVACDGRYLLYRASDTSWPVAFDFGVGSRICGIAAFRGQQAHPYAFIAFKTAATNVAQTAKVWDLQSFTATFADEGNATKVVDYITYREEMWVLSQNVNGQWQVQKVLDGGVTPTLGGAFIIADGATVQCKSFVVSQDRLLVRSTKGLLAVNAQENDAQEVTGSTFYTQYQNLNEFRPVAFGQFVVNETASSLYAYDAQSGGTAEIGIGTRKDNDNQVVTGVHTTATPYRLWTVYTWTWNASNNMAYLWRWGEHELIDTLYSPVPFSEELPCIYGSLYEQNTQVNGSIASEIGGVTPRLYWIDTASKISFMPLSRMSANPYSDPAVTANTTNTSEIYLPACTSRNSVEVKSNSAIALTGLNFSPLNFWTASYRTDPTMSYGNGTNLLNSGQFTQPIAQRNDWVVASTCNWLDVKLSVSNSSASSPPLIKSVTVYQVLRPVFKWVYTAVLRLSDKGHLRSGAERGRLYSVADDREFLENLAGTAGIVPLTTVDNTSVQVLVTNLSMIPGKRDPRERPDWFATVEMTEHRSVGQHGLYLRLEPFTYSFLQNYTYAQLEKL